jgi:hypothetical protein
VIPRQSPVYDESRNSSQVRPPSPTALRDALASLRSIRASQPSLVRWIEDNYPLLTEAEHVERFGESYQASKPRRRATALPP